MDHSSGLKVVKTVIPNRNQDKALQCLFEFYYPTAFFLPVSLENKAHTTEKHTVFVY